MTKFFFTRLTGSFFFLFLFFNAEAQHLDSLFNELGSKYPQEKVYLQFDRPYYNSGETIWFKAYITADNQPIPISKTLYAELLDEKGHLLQEKIMPVIESGASSNFDLPDSMRHTLLYVRAYTSWMLNFDSSLFFLKPIHIISANSAHKKNTEQVSYSLHFFPEGGDMVAGVNSRIAFKANNQNSIPVEASGNILDSRGNKVSSFLSVHDGMGYFSLIPLAGEKYKAKWKDKKGAQHETDLPEVKTQGVVLSLNNTGNEVDYTLSRPENAADPFTSFYVVAQMQQQLMYSAKINMTQSKTVQAPIKVDSFPDGIMQVTVFNAEEIPVAERIVFINHDNYFFNTDLHAEEKSLDKRGHNVLQIDVGGSLKTNLSIAVTNAALNPVSDNETNIFSDLLLSSDIKGFVYNPAYYFSSDEDSVRQQLDLVMMTNGWRRFKWENLLAGNWPLIKTKSSNYLSINGKVYGLSQNQLSGKEVNLMLKTKNAGLQVFTAPVTKDGSFNVDSLYFFDTAHVYYQFNNDKDRTLTSTASFSIFSNFASPPVISNDIFDPFKPAQLPDSSTNAANIIAWNKEKTAFDESKVKLLDVVVVKSHEKSREEKMNDEYTSGFFTDGQAKTFIVEDDPYAGSGVTVLNYLQGKVAGLQITIDGSGNATATWRGSNTSFFLDEVNADLTTLQSISMTDVAMIKVFEPPFYGGAGGAPGGAIAVYTKKGGEENPMIKGLDNSIIIGYSSIKEFYSPDYEKTNPAEGDYRTTLYWNPFLLMDDKKRRITIPFYNSDNCKKFRVIIEGINEAGQLTREEKIFE